jgi:type IV pilus modification protein PilV
MNESVISNEKGFTLIEAIIALFVLTIGVLAMMTLQTTAIRSNFQASTMTTASCIAADQLEQLRTLPFLAANLKPVSSPFVITDPATGYQVTWTVANAPAPMAGSAKDIVVTVNRPQPFAPVVFSYRKFRDL